ncbi:MAG: hypothetical protein ACOCUS_05775 [Polyangiales bacterium]
MDVKKAAWIAAVLLGVGVAATWGWAKWSLEDRVSGFAQEVHGIGVERGMDSIPGEERVAEQVREMAASRSLEIVELEVSVQELSDDNMDRADFVTRETGERVEQALDRGAGGEARRGPALEMKGSLVEVRALVRGEQWLWEVDDEIEVSKVLGRRMEMKR